jgi:hypothetical protein
LKPLFAKCAVYKIDEASIPPAAKIWKVKNSAVKNIVIWIRTWITIYGLL